LTEQI